MDYNEYKIDSVKQKTKNKIIISIAVIFIMLLILICLFFCSTYFNDKNENINNVDYSDVVDENTTSENTFCVVCIDDENNIEFISLIKSQIYNKTFYITMVSPDDIVKTDISEISLKQHYSVGGVNELVNALNVENEINIDRYILVTKENLTMIFGEMGHITVDIKSPVTLNVSEGSVKIEKGKQELDYEEICDYLINGCKDGNKLIFQGNFICTIMEQYLKNADYSRTSELFSDLINYVETDISVIDYISNQDIIAAFENAEFAFINTLDN